MSTLRDLASLKLAVARIEHAGDNQNLRQISSLPLATEATKKYQFPLHCQRTGIYIGSISTINVAGHSPFLGQWRDSQAFHPVFSLPAGAKLKLARESYLRFCALSADEIANTELVAKQEELMQVLLVAILHDMADVKQDSKWMPTFATTVANWKSLISLSYWRLYLESTRFKFPSFRVFPATADGDLRGFLEACWERKKDYERGITAAIDREAAAQAAEAERIMVRIRDDIAGKRPMAPKLLWRWFEQNMPKRYTKDINGWMSDIFFANEKQLHQLEVTVKDIETFAEMAAAELPTGSSISHAFFEVVNSKHQLLANYYQGYAILDSDWEADFVVDQPTTVAGEAVAVEPQPEPQRHEFDSTAKYLIAKSKWHLANAERTTHRRAALEKQQQLTVKPSFIPELPWQEEADDADDLVLGAMMQAHGHITNQQEDQE